ncbi:hypothetical protein F4561_002594 [Lipingzhangella halophila]|uniref:Lantibiotic dehydratase N-terminal domain-containing protein n=1 Tax=Lipingzhangella halophila TaxID=1783352 RepID=A0A7W7RGZ2_9ACTN|nr:lantibiotic dehydratase [Lipingzhangella halophila]MBB4931774.1 hypothetical protein [Lipingzhangella halophila]
MEPRRHTWAARDGDRGTESLLAPFFLLRVGGLPVTAVERLRSSRTLAWAREVLRSESALAEQAGPARDALGEAVGATNDPGLRRELLALRRDVHNGRMPRDPARAGELADLLGRSDRVAVATWLSHRDAHEAALSRGDDVLAEERAEAVQHLRQLADDPRLRAGIQLGAPLLDRQLDSYVADPGGRRAHKVERSLLSYAFRAACKTSPFSTLTPVALGRFRDGGPALVGSDTAGARPVRPRGHARLNLVAVARLAEAVVADPTLRADLPVELTVGWRVERDRVRYLRRTLDRGHDDALVTPGILHEREYHLNRGPFLDDLLAVAEKEAPIPLGELAVRLSDADPRNRPLPVVERYLGQMLDYGLLVIPVLRTDPHHPDPVERLRADIASLGHSWSDSLARRLERVGRHVSDFPSADIARRRDTERAVRQELDAAQDELGQTPPRTPATAIYEDATVGDLAAWADRERWEQRMLPGLRGLSELLPVFDSRLPKRLVAREFFRLRHGAGGACADLVGFAQEFHDDCFGRFLAESPASGRFVDGPDGAEYRPQSNPLRQPELDALDTARKRLAELVDARYRDLPESATELCLDDDVVSEVAGLLPGDRAELSPHTYFVQVDAEAERAAVSWIYTGLTVPLSRFVHGLAEAGEDTLASDIRTHLADATPDGAVFAELSGGHTMTNLGLHPPVLPYELVCPGDVSHRPAERRILVDDLVVHDDEDSGRLRLWSRRLGTWVVPVYLGFLMPTALPELHQVLLAFSHASIAGLDLWNGVSAPPREGGAQRRPRISYRNLVLQRRKWKVHPDDLPRPGKRGRVPDARWFLEWTRWSDARGLPRRVFVAPDTRPTAGRRGGPRVAAVRKPQYVDFDSYHSLCQLENVLDTVGDTVVLTEMLPDTEQLWLRTPEGRHVTEMGVELDIRPSAPGASGRSATRRR